MILNLTKQKNWLEWVKFTPKVIAFWLLVISSQFLVRLAMYFLYSTESSPESSYTNYIDNAFLMGLRFDFGVANQVLAFLLLISFIILLFRSSSLWRIYHKLSSSLLIGLLWITTFASICNLTFYHYFTDHFNLLVFGLWEDDTVALGMSVWENEPILRQLLAIALLFYGQKKLFDYIAKKSRSLTETAKWQRLGLVKAKLWKRSLVYVLSFLSIGFGARGTFDLDMHPLNRMHTEVSPYHFLNQLSFSPIYALVDTIVLGLKVRSESFDLIADLGYRDNINRAYSDYLGIKLDELPENPSDLLNYNSGSKAKNTKPHVVVFAMESMGSFWLKFESPDYPIMGKMAEHATQDVFNTQFLPSGSGTYPSVTHWLLNMATLPGVAPAEKFLDQDFSTSAVKPFKEAGYKTHYMYGGGLGWRNLSGFLYQLGFDELHGETRIKEELGSDIETHPWGVFDKELFTYVERHLKNATEPQLLFVLSTTNHPPFDVPSDVKSIEFQFPESLSSRMTENSKTLQQRLNAYRYSMDSLGGFINKMKSWDKDLIIAASGDHSFYESVAFKPSDIVEQWGVPFYLYSSQENLKSKLNNVYGSHANIFPTLYDLALDDIDYIAISPSLLREVNVPAASSTGFAEEGVQYNRHKVYFGDSSKAQADEASYLAKWKAYFAIAMQLIEDSPKVSRETSAD